jgi:hypothetical protein
MLLFPSVTPGAFSRLLGCPPKGGRLKEMRYALNKAPCYKGPSKSSGRYFYKPDARAPMTLTANEKYAVLESKDGWSRVRFFPPDISEKTGLVESKDLAASLPATTAEKIRSERFNGVNDLLGSGKWRGVHAGMRLNGKKLTLLVSDQWHLLSHDRKEAYFKDAYVLFFSIGKVRNIDEKPDDYEMDVRHSESGRVLATWGSLFGFRLKD